MKNRHIAVLGSTRGTGLEPVINAIEIGKLHVSVDLVISDKQNAYILTRAHNHGIPTYYVDPKGKSREAFDREILDILSKYAVDLILLIGYMRILSKPFIDRYKDRILNVHPSLLPAFAGGMDLNVHEEVLKSGVKETGCTIHLVDEGTDTGKILLQKNCPVLAGDTSENLKKRVQVLEGEAFIEILNTYNPSSV